jgi:signal transduction histidine kinase
MSERADIPTPPSNPSLDVASLMQDNEELRAEVARLRHLAGQLETRMAGIQEIGVAMGSTLSLDDLLGVIMEKITQVMDADRSTLFLVEGDYLWSKVIQGDRVSEIRLRIGEGIAGWVARSGKSVNIRDAYRDHRFNPEVDLRTGYHTRSILCQPIRNQEREIIGVIQVLNRHTGYFTVEDEHLLSALAAQAAISLENSKLYLSVVSKNLELMETQEKLENKIAEVDLLFEVQREVAQAANLTEMLQAVASKVMEQIRASVCAVVLREENHLRMFWLRAGRGETLQEAALADGEGITHEVMVTGEPVICNHKDAACISYIPSERLGLQVESLLSVPMFYDDRCIGTLELLNRQGMPTMSDGVGGALEFTRPRFNRSDMKLLTLLAGQLSASMATFLDREQQEKAERLKSIGQMLSGVIHDFKTPVTIISGYVQLMSQQDDPALRQEFAQSVLKQFDQLNKMIREILAFARGESQMLLRKIFLHKLADELREVLDRDMSDRGIELIIDNHYGGWARLDEVKIKRALFNLARNAAEAMPRGGQVKLDFRREEDELIIQVSDTGQGIPPEIRENLFESFVTRGKKQGTGLGLAIVKKIVEDHQGSISFETATGQGTTFTLRLPIDQEQEAP